MRICVVSRRNATRDPEIRALAGSLDSVGHQVTLVCTGTPEPGLPEGVRVVSLTPESTRGLWRRLRRRLTRSATRQGDLLDAAIRRTIMEVNPDLIYPHREEDITLVDDLAIPVVRRPEWHAPTYDLISLAPHSIGLSSSPMQTASHVESSQPPTSIPAPHRHEGRSVVIAYRVTPTNPGRYLEAALRRSGATVTVLDGILDWDRVPSDASFVVIVESPYPALEVQGTNPGAPVLFWVHHGEHHLPANLRLAGRYRVNGVLLAHSWHLAHRFPVPVHRFPFAAPPEMIGEPRSWEERIYDVAMVGAGVGGSGSRYDRRRQIIESLGGEASMRTKFAYGLSPEEMYDVYGEARIVINDGGRRHLPITMRVFEVLGSGALLLTEDLPGTDVLLRRDDHYIPMADDVLRQTQMLLADEMSAAIAEAGHQWVLNRHTYDHRVDQLFEIAAQTSFTDSPQVAFTPATPLAALIDRDVEAQHLAVFGETGDLGLADRAIRIGDVGRLRDSSIDAVVIGAGAVTELDRAVLAARGYVYAGEGNAIAVQDILALHRPDAVISFESGLLRADLGGTGYRMRHADHPLAS